MNSGQIGDCTEIVVMASAMRAGYPVAVPHGHAKPYDLLVERNDGTWAKVQAKTITCRGHKMFIPARRSKQVTGVPRERRYQLGDFDVLAGVEPGTYHVWLIHFDCINGKTQVTTTRCTKDWEDVL